MIFRVLNVDVLILDIVIGLFHFRTIFKCELNGLIQRKKTLAARLAERFPLLGQLRQQRERLRGLFEDDTIHTAAAGSRRLRARVEQALQTLATLASAGEEVALVLTGKSPSDATGGELLERAKELHPHAKPVP